MAQRYIGESKLRSGLAYEAEILPLIPSNDSGSISFGACTVIVTWSHIMLVSVPSSQPCDNRLLDLLLTDDYHPLAPYLEQVDLDIRETIAERGQPIHYIYFPCTAVLSVLNRMLDGQLVEVGTIG